MIRKKIKKFLNESIPFLFIGQGQVDTWHHLRGLPETSSSRNMEKIHFLVRPSNFARWCEVEDLSALFSSSWSVSKLLLTFLLVCCSQNSFCFISHGHVKLKNMLFRLLFAISPISSFLIHLHHF